MFLCSAATATFVSTLASAQSCEAPLAAALGANAFDTTGSIVDVDLTGVCDPGPAGTDIIYKTIFFDFTPAEDGSYSVSTCNAATFDTKIAVMNTCVPAEGVLACNDDGTGCAGFSSNIPAVQLLAGVTYKIALGGYSATTPTGTGTLTIALNGGGGGGGGGSGNCEKAPEAFEGDNAFTTDPSLANLDLTGLCDPGPFGDDQVYFATYFTFTPTQDGLWTATTCNITGWDTRIAVLTACDPTSVIACNDDGAGCANFSSICEFNATAGVPVIVALGGYDATAFGAGTFQLVYGSTVVGCGDPAAGDCCVANGTPACSDEACCTLVCAADAFCCDTEWDQICADTAAQLCKLCGAVPCIPDCSAATVEEGEECSSDINGGCNNPAGSVSYINLGDAVCGNYWADADTRDTDWYEFTSPGTFVSINVYGELPTAVGLLDANCPPGVLFFNADGGCPATIASTCLPASTYRVFVGASLFGGFPCPGGSYLLEVINDGIECSGPANDECDGAVEVFEGDTAFDTTLAVSGGALDPICDKGFGTAIAKDIWFSFTATQDSFYRISTCNQAAFDTRLAIYTGDCLAPSILACNDDGAGCTGLTSEMFAELTTGTTYLIQVGGFNGGGTGTLTIAVSGPPPACGSPDAGDCCVANTTPFCSDAECCNIVCAADAFCCNTQWDQFCADAAATLCTSCGGSGPPANDECVNAVEIFVGVTEFSTVGATGTNANVCAKFGNPNLYNDIWYVYEATGDALCTISTCNTATFDTKIAIYENACDGALVGCNDDGAGCAGFTSIATFTPVCGNTYYIAVGAYGAAGSGSGQITLTQDGKCSGSNCPADLNGDGLVNAADLTTLLASWGGTGGDINGDGTTNAADITSLLAAWGQCQ
jgi:hypothetical protein